MGEEESNRGGDGLGGITDSENMNWSKLREMVKAREPGALQSMGLQRIGHNLAAEQQQ